MPENILILADWRLAGIVDDTMPPRDPNGDDDEEQEDEERNDHPLVDDTIPPRDPHGDDDEEQENEEQDEDGNGQPPVVREPDPDE
jgi:hypothetical protein